MSTPPRRTVGPVALAARIPVAGLVAAALLAGCASGPGGSPGPSASAGAITHPSGATELVLRVFVGGGFVPPGYFATEAPAFSLYGDGTVIFREASDASPSSTDAIVRGQPFLQVRLSEAAVQALLGSALDVGGLRAAREEYTLPVADAPTTTFTIDAGGLRKQVSVNGLGIVPDTAAGTDRAELIALQAFRDRLLAFGSTATSASAWVADRYRGTLLDGTTGTGRPWPWTTFTPESFTNVSDTGSLAFPTRILSRSEVDALGIPNLGGGAIGILLRSPVVGGPLLSLNLRPLLPDEKS
ncbi:MAG: hypothetical protein HY263_06465 [Chloroflexi bacterium]|nr:hypothetical protein [Chloroflexota bacterium]